MEKATKKQLKTVVDNMASDIIFWQKKFNMASEELVSLDGKKRLGVLVVDKERVIESHLSRLRPEGD